MSVVEVPALGEARQLRVPKTAERVLDNGLTVIAVRRPAVPLFELRLRVPFGRAHLARAAVLSQTLLSGTSDMSNVDIAAELQTVGGGLSVSIDPDRLLIAGNGLAGGLGRVLELLAGVLTDSTYPNGEVATERERLADRIRVARTQPSHLAREVLLKRMYGKHPYAVQTPEADQVLGVRPAALRTLHTDRVRPDGAILVLVGDLSPEKAIDAAAAALADWTGSSAAGTVPALPDLEPGAIALAHRVGSVQSSLRIALPAVPRTHPDHAKISIANLVYGGYFSSRLVENIREDKGYTYSPRSGVEHSGAGSRLVVSADVATEVTAPSLLETWYELGRLAVLPVSDEEVELARQYALGSLLLGMSTQSGQAGLVSTLAAHGLRLDWLTGHAERLNAVTSADIAEVAAEYFAPAKGVTVILGDADAVEPSLSSLQSVERV